MTQFMIELREWLRPLLDSNGFAVLYGLLVFLNPLAILPQLVNAVRKKVEGVSVLMFIIFALIQLAVSAGAINVLDWKLFLSMGISFFESVAIIICILMFRRPESA